MKELLQEIQLPAYEFTENPVPMDRVDYDDAFTKVIRETSRFAGLVSIYSLHQEIYPGLSKLRLCYVISDTADENALRKGLIPTLKKIRGEEPSLDMVQFYTQSVFQHIDQVIPFFYLKHEYGQDIRFAALTGGERQFAYILALNDRLVISPLKVLLPMLVDGVIAVKPAWQGIESTIDLIHFYQKAIGKVPAEWQELIKKTHELGRHWFSMNLGRYQEIKQLVRDAVIILLEMTGGFIQHLQKEKLFFVQEGVTVAPGQKPMPVPKEYRASLLTDSVTALFIDGWSPETGFRKMANLLKKTKGICVYLPTLMSVPYVLYLKGTELHASLVQKFLLYHGFSGNVAMPGVVDTRNRWLSEHLAFTLKYADVIEYPIWFGYRLDTPSKWTKWLENRKQAQHEKWQHNQSLELARI